MSEAPHYTGFLERAPTGEYVGELRDRHGWGIALSAEIEDFAGRKRFKLVGMLGDTPVAFRVPGLDPVAEPPA